MDHYLEILTRKPGALPGATALAQARAAGTTPPRTGGTGTRAGPHAGDAASTRAMVEVLAPTRNTPPQHWSKRWARP